MSGDVTVLERLRQAREATGCDLSALESRIRVRAAHLRAIEEGRFGDLPAGIYARSAVRALASACGLDPAEVLAACQDQLPSVEEPIRGLARVHGLRSNSAEPE